MNTNTDLLVAQQKKQIEPRKKVALIYDWLDTQHGGFERVLQVLLEIFPQADVFTTVYDKNVNLLPAKTKVYTSFLQYAPRIVWKFRYFFIFFYQRYFESINLTSYDLVFSATSAHAKSCISRPETKHIAYILTPPRHLWSMESIYFSSLPRWMHSLQFFYHIFTTQLRKKDTISAQRADIVLTLSHAVKNRIKSFYNRDALVVYPPFDFSYWNKIKNDISVVDYSPELNIDLPAKYYLIVSRLEKYKFIELAIEVCKLSSSLPLVIVGTGRDATKLQKKATKNIYFLGTIDDHSLGFLYRRAEALLMPQEEDFGYVALEAQFFCCPVIAYAKGGALETVQNGETGILFQEQSVEGLRRALAQFHTVSYNLHRNLKDSKKYLKKYSKEHFITTINSLVYQQTKVHV